MFITSPESERGGRQSKAEVTQEKILAAAHDSLDEVGIRRTSVDAVARRAAVSRGTVYLYFADKQALVSATLLRNSDALRNQLAERLDRVGPLGEQLAVAAEFSVLPQPGGLIATLRDREPELLALIVLTESQSWIRKSAQFWRPRLQAAHERGELRAGLDLDAAAEWVARTLYTASVVPSERVDLHTSRVGRIGDYIREFLLCGLGCDE